MVLIMSVFTHTVPYRSRINKHVTSWFSETGAAPNGAQKKLIEVSAIGARNLRHEMGPASRQSDFVTGLSMPCDAFL